MDSLKEKLFEIASLKPELQYHKNYDRTVNLAKEYSQLISGKDIDVLLKQFVRRESEEMFEQRKRLTQQITPSICNTIIKTFNKIFRTTPAIESIDFEGSDVDKKVTEVKNALSTIYGEKDIYKYMQDRFMYYSFIDPNAFIYTTFAEFDNTNSKPEPYNIEITSVNAINYEYFNNILLWLISRVDNPFEEQGKTRDGYIYTIYGKQFAYSLTQVGKDYVANEGEEIVKLLVNADNEEYNYFILNEYEHKAQVIPLIQVGYERDLETDGETYVSPIHSGVPYLMKLIKVVSEFDLTNCLHVFPKLFQYVESCTFTNGNCNDSHRKQEFCDKCNKTGIRTHQSAQDAILLKMPKMGEDLQDLSKMIHTEVPDVALLEFQDTLIDKYSTKVNKAVFNSETFTKDEVAKTATGENIDMQNVYDTLKPFAEKISDVWEHVAYVSSNYLDYYDPIVHHAYPNDFKLKTSAELLAELSIATSSQAAGYITSAIETDIMREKYIDSPDEFTKYEAKQKFFPFKGKTKDEIQQIVLSGMVRENDIILYNYFETIFSEIESEFESNGIWFYNMNINLQRKAITEKIEEIKSEIEQDKSIEFSGDIIS